MKARKIKIRLAMFLFWLLLAYIGASLVWWFIELSLQNNAMASLKISALQKDASNYKIQYDAVLKQKQTNLYQYLGEGSIFLILILTGATFLFRGFIKEIKDAAKQKHFMMAITHELKTPIAIAKLNLETIQKHKLTEQQQEKLLSNTLQETNRLDTLCNNLLLTNQLDDGGYLQTKETINLSTIVYDCFNNFSTRFPLRDINANIEKNIFILGDTFLLQMAINNLVENALKYSPKDKPVTINLFGNVKQTSLQVIDEGQGITEKEKALIFNKYYRIGNKATKTAKGTGLGLYLVTRICKTHDAKITIENNPNGGSIFTFTANVIHN